MPSHVCVSALKLLRLLYHTIQSPRQYPHTTSHTLYCSTLYCSYVRTVFSLLSFPQPPPPSPLSSPLQSPFPSPLSLSLSIPQGCSNMLQREGANIFPGKEGRRKKERSAACDALPALFADRPHSDQCLCTYAHTLCRDKQRWPK